MALYLPVRSLNRSQSVRIGQAKLTPDSTTYVDITDGKVKRDLQRHSAIGAILVVGPLSSSAGTVVVREGVVTTAQGTPDQTVDVSAGELHNRSSDTFVSVAASDNLAATAAHATLARVDIVQVDVTDGTVSYKAGTAAASPVAPDADADNIAVAQVARAANDNTIASGDITDVRPR